MKLKSHVESKVPRVPGVKLKRSGRPLKRRSHGTKSVLHMHWDLVLFLFLLCVCLFIYCDTGTGMESRRH